MLSLKNKIMMDFITDNGHTILYADISYFFQFFCAPHSSHRIVRIAQEKQFYIFLHDFLLKILKIDVITVVFSLIKVAAHYFSAIVLNNL